MTLPDRNTTSSRGRHRSLPARSRQLLPFVLLAVLVGATLVPVVDGSDTAQAAGVRRLAADTMARSVPSGLGTATVGGKYSTRSTSKTYRAAVSKGSASLAGIRPGKFAEAWLPAVSGHDVEARVQFTVPTIPARGTGTYLALDLRRLSNGDTYRARLRVSPGGVVHLGFSRVRKNVETTLGKEVTLPKHVKAGTTMVLDGAATGGTKKVILSVRAWVVGKSAAKVAWQQRVSDSSTHRLAGSGSVGMWTYDSGRSNLTSALRVSVFQAYEIPNGADHSPLPTVGAAPSSTHPAPAHSSSAASSTHPRAPSSTAKSTRTSSAPVTKTSTPKPAPTTSAPTPPPAGSAGSAQPGGTHYAVPSSHALFVAPQGNDSASGSQGAPLHTLAKAIAKAPSGSTIVLRGGTYHEAVVVPSNKTLTIQSYPNEAAWLDGSSAVTTWTHTGNVWVHNGWTAHFDHSPSFSFGGNSGFVNPAYPMAAHPDELFINGQQQAQVASASKVKPGTFFVDYSAHKLVIGSSPNSVRASDLAQALQVNSPGTVLRGFGVRNYADPAAELGAVLLAGKGDVAENLTVQSNATIGLVVAATGSTVRHVTVQDNGLLGMLANYADGLVIDSIYSQRNNSEHFNEAPTSAGTKITRSRGVIVRNSTFTNNYATGLWVDESSYNVSIIGNHIYNNSKHGFSWEIGAKGIIADNVITGNASNGMKINDVTHVRIWNNTLGNNGLDIDLVQDARRASDLHHAGHDPRQKLPDPTVTWLLGDISVYNNLIQSPAHGSNELYARDASKKRSAAAMQIVVGGNTFAPMTSGSMIMWGTTAARATAYKTVSAFQAGTGSYGDGSTVSGTSPRALPGDIAALLGERSGVAHVGAF